MVDYLSDEFYEKVKAELKGRVDERRFQHCLNVSALAMELAQIYGVDVAQARLVGILHDWDKGYSKEEIKERARRLGVNTTELVYDLMPRILHGQTAALALAEEYPDMPCEVLQAIDRHTQAAIDMSDLDMIVYISDAVEPSRNFEGLDVIRDKIGKIPLEELFYVVLADILKGIINQDKTMNPTSVDVWNYYVMRHRKANNSKGNL